MVEHKIFVDGTWITSSGTERIPVIDPATEETFSTIANATAEDVSKAVAAANTASKSEWSWSTGRDRAVFLRAIARSLEARTDELAGLEVRDMGKPLKEAYLDLEDSIRCFDYYAGLALELDEKQDSPVPVADDSFTTRLRYDPVGVAALITPWNFPLLVASFKLAPALAAGCAVILKPSEHASMTCLELGNIARDVGLPNGVLNILTGLGAQAGDVLVSHDQVDKVSFTGSKPTATKIMNKAAERIANITLELGGKSPIIVCDDADIEKTLEWICFGVFWNQGEVCSSTSRLLVHSAIADELIDRLVERTKQIKIGSGMHSDSQMGPIAFQDQYEKIRRYIHLGKEEGAELRCGGQRPRDLETGYFLEPTIFTNVTPEMRIWNEEIFGPVLCVREFSDDAVAIDEANRTDYGLSAAVVSADGARAERIARSLDAGVVWINCSQPAFIEAPWGGRKQSGIGREFGWWGLENFLEIKQMTEYVAPSRWDWYMSG